jgi:hypothetical protein
MAKRSKRKTTKSAHNHTELQKLSRRPVAVEDLLLDPRNPRFPVPLKAGEARFAEAKIQERAAEYIDGIGIDDLMASIGTYGFVPTDPIVVRPLKGQKKYVVLEGNRRVATLKALVEANETSTAVLEAHVLSSIKNLEVLVYEGKDENIAWILQGLRHMTGIKEWPPLQQAEFLAKIEKQLSSGKRQPSIPAIAKEAGVSVAKASRLLNAYYALKQAQEDDEYGSSSELPNKFSVFAEGVSRSTSLEGWLDWNAKKRRIGNKANLKKLLSWVLPNEKGEVRITRAIDVRDVLSQVVADPKLLARFEAGSLDIDQARTEIEKSKPRPAVNLARVREQLEGLRTELETLPLATIVKDKKVDEFTSLIRAVKEIADTQVKMLSHAG